MPEDKDKEAPKTEAPRETPPEEAKAAATEEEQEQKKLERAAKREGGAELADSLRDQEGNVHDSSTVHGEVTARSDLRPASATPLDTGKPSGTQVNPIDDDDPAKKAAEKVQERQEG